MNVLGDLDSVQPPAVEPVTDLIGNRILAAASEQFGAQGIRKSSVEDVARRAGVSRITVYRRFKNKDVLIEQVIIRELQKLMTGFEDAVSKPGKAADVVVDGVAIILRSINGNPLYKEALLWGQGPDAEVQGRSYDESIIVFVIDFVARLMRREQETLRLPADLEVDVVAELLVRLTVSFVITPAIKVDFNDEAEVQGMVAKYLVPMLGV
ncbi:TetR/AcrR family transcriptional regulator [Arthrobacter russicus]|jgi:TetR/AcrR family transcriptional repressor of uid operon|uniref:AcrR family transcriptional regulator n=1 Tax=Arthrobacter russicus TaxID=172040 RepID=A0ABU1JCT2_9MICC|nr:helix-turn-helix domain-containing protein [Arthrobacter russicus]MDR6269241.1 AcrR family transcriptional regulator [Arthrobacter russicus]